MISLYSMRLTKQHIAVFAIVLFSGSNLAGSQEEQSNAGENTGLEAEVLRYQERLADFRGNYDQDIAELNLSLASALAELGRHDEAANAYEEALQAIRVNEGLYSAAQLPILEGTINSALSARDWEQADQKFYLALSIVERQVPITDPRYQKWVRWFTDWKVASYRNYLEVSENSRSLEDAVALYEHLLSGLSEDDADYDEKLRIYTGEKSLAHYFSALNISSMPYEEFASQAPETITGQRCYVVMRNGQPTTVCSNTRVPNPDYFESRQQAKGAAMQRHIRAMLDGHRDLIATMRAEPATDPIKLAEAVLRLGDINFLLRDLERAESHYAEAHRILVNAGVEESVMADMLGEPKEILGGFLGEDATRFQFEEATPSGKVSFDVTAEGVIENLAITGQEDDLDADNQDLIAERLRRSVYRPQLQDGAPVRARLEQVPAAEL